MGCVCVCVCVCVCACLCAPHGQDTKRDGVYGWAHACHFVNRRFACLPMHEVSARWEQSSGSYFRERPSHLYRPLALALLCLVFFLPHFYFKAHTSQLPSDKPQTRSAAAKPWCTLGNEHSTCQLYENTMSKWKMCVPLWCFNSMSAVGFLFVCTVISKSWIKKHIYLFIILNYCLICESMLNCWR